MKKLIVLLFVFVCIKPVSAATSTPSSNLDDLKERLATKVAELRTTEKRAVFGSVKSITLTTLVLETKTKDVKIELPDEVAVYQYLKGKRTKLAIDDATKGDIVTVYGDYDTTLELLKGTYIFIQKAAPIRVSGVVEGIDRSDYSLNLKTETGQIYTVDIETTTKLTRWDKTNKFTKSGFSKMVAGEAVHVVGTAVPKKENRISAVKILNLGNPIGEATTSATPTP